MRQTSSLSRAPADLPIPTPRAEAAAERQREGSGDDIIVDFKLKLSTEEREREGGERDRGGRTLGAGGYCGRRLPDSGPLPGSLQIRRIWGSCVCSVSPSDWEKKNQGNLRRCRQIIAC